MSFDTAPNRDDRLTPQLIAALEFSSHLRGYNRDEVRAFLVKVAAQMSSLEEALSRSRVEIEVLKRDSGNQLQIGELEASKVGEHAAEVVRIASDTARAIRIQAESQAEAIVQRAERSARRIVEDAEAKAESLQMESSQSAEDALQRAKKQGDEFLNYAEAQGNELIQKAKEEGRAIVYRAKELRSSYLNDARSKVDELMKEMSELEAARNSILTILNGAARMIARVESSLDPEHLYLKSVEDDDRAHADGDSIPQAKGENTHDEDPESSLQDPRESEAFEDAPPNFEDRKEPFLEGSEQRPSDEIEELRAVQPSTLYVATDPQSEVELIPEVEIGSSEVGGEVVHGEEQDQRANYFPQADAIIGESGEDDGELGGADLTEAEALFEEDLLEGSILDSVIQDEVEEYFAFDDEDELAAYPSDQARSADTALLDSIVDEPISISHESTFSRDVEAIQEPTLAETISPTASAEGPVIDSPATKGVVGQHNDSGPPHFTAQVDAERLNRLEELFERMRVSRNSEALEANSVLSLDEVPHPEVEESDHRAIASPLKASEALSDMPRGAAGTEGASVVLGETEMALIESRDASIQPALLQLSRRTKRLLQDDQNELLDALRKGGVEGANFMTKELSARLEQRVEDLKELLLPAVEAGFTSVGAVANPVSSFEIARQVLEELLALLNQLSLTKVKGSLLIHDGGNESDQIGGISGIYRDLRSSKLDSIIEDAVVSAHARGALAGSVGQRVRWIAHDKGNTCPDCEDNALNGETTSGELFPTSHSAPPAHPGCRCLITVERA